MYTKKITVDARYMLGFRLQNNTEKTTDYNKFGSKIGGKPVNPGIRENIGSKAKF